MLKIDKVHEMSDYLALLSTSQTIYIDNERLTRAAEEAMYTSEDFRNLAAMWLRIESAGSYYAVSPDNILDYLEDIGVDLEKRYRNKKTAGYSLDMKKVVLPLIESGVAVDLLSAYKEHRSYKSYSSFLHTLETTKPPVKSTESGRLILPYATHLEEKENLRVYYSDIAAVSIPKMYSDIVTGKDDSYYIAWCDYPQADWRFAYNLFIKDEENAAVMCQHPNDAYAGLAHIVEQDAFDPVEFKSKRTDYKVNCLKVFYNSKDNREIPTAMREYFMSRPKYKKMVYDLNLLYQFKLPVPCESYFGFEQLLPEGRYPDAFVSKGMNTPIQTFTSHVVNETVFGVLERFWELGYTKDDINVYFVRHDEPIFMFKKTILKDSWVFKDCSSIHIDGFTPILLDFHFGRYYTEDDEDLTSEIQLRMEEHPELLHNYEEGKAKEYNPIPTVESVYAQFYMNEETKTYKVLFRDYRETRSLTVQTNSDDLEEALHLALEQEALAWLDTPRYLLVRNNGLEFIDSIGEDTLLKVWNKFDNGMVMAGYGEE